MRSPLARITGADKSEGGNLPLQQVSSMGRVGDATIVHPYALYANLPDNTLVYMIAPGVAVPCNIQNPDDSERGEPVFFHPTTKTRIIARNNSDLDVISDTAVNITAPDIILAGDVTTEKFGTNGKSAQASFALGAAATDLPTVIALANNIRLALIANGIGS